MKYLLTSNGITNPSIHAALLDLLGKPTVECNALCIPTAIYPFPGGPSSAYRFISGSTANPTQPMIELGWKSVGVLELTALPSIDKERWVSWVRETDVLLVYGGDTLYLAHWMRESGLADLLPSLGNKVWVGLSGGSVVLTPRIWKDFIHWTPPPGEEEPLGMVDFSIFPHMDHEMLPTHSMAYVAQWSASLSNPGYAIDDDTAIKVVDGTVEVISEGNWKLFTPSSTAAQTQPSV
jgi:dipeptidase E